MILYLIIVIGFVFGFIILGCAIVIGITYKWHTKLQSHYSMIKRWSFHPPHDPEKVVINESENKYFSVRFSIPKYFEIDNKNFSLNSSDEIPIPVPSQVPDLVVNQENTEIDSNEDKVDQDEQQVTRRKVFYRKPSKYIRPPELSLVEEENDEDLFNATSARNSGRGSMVINPSTRSSFRDSMVVYEDSAVQDSMMIQEISDSEGEYIEESNNL